MTTSEMTNAIPVSLGILPRNERPVALGFISVEILVGQSGVAQRDHYQQVGYQRPPSPTRVKQLATRLSKKRVDIPTALLLNFREYDSDEHLIGHGDMRHLNLQEQKLYVVDGQHRVEALRLLFEEDPQRWGSMGVPFVCMLGANEEEEMEQFYAVNANSKSVPTGLAFDLLKQQASNNASLFQELQETGKAWIIRGGDIVEHLESAPIWAGRVRFTGQPKAATTVGNDGFVNSLRPLLNSPFFSQMETDDQIQVLQAFWSGVKIVLPDAFDEPGDYVLQKSTGVATLHLLLVSVIELVRNKNQSLIDPESYSQMLEKPFQSLSEVSPTGEAVSGSDFWKSGGQGAAGSFSSNAGRRVLVARLRENLPKVSIT